MRGSSHFPGDPPDPGSNPRFLCLLHWQVDSSPLCHLGSPNLLCLQGRRPGVRFLGREDPLEKEMAIHSSTLAWKIPWTEEPDRLQSMGSQRVGHD